MVNIDHTRGQAIRNWGQAAVEAKRQSAPSRHCRLCGWPEYTRVGMERGHEGAGPERSCHGHLAMRQTVVPCCRHGVLLQSAPTTATHTAGSPSSAVHSSSVSQLWV